MIFGKEETRNLINMLKSSDADNHIMAFESLKNVKFNNYIGEILVIYKYTGHNLAYWQDNCAPVYKKLLKLLPEKPLTSPATLSLITAHNGSKTSIELFMEYFVRNMTKMLEQIGYPTDSFEINITLKDNG